MNKKILTNAKITLQLRFLLMNILFLSVCYCRADIYKSGNDIKLFNETPVWKLAKAVAKNDRREIIKNAQNENVNFQESRFGRTLLMLAVHNNWRISTEALLDIGADPNIKDNLDGRNAVIEAAGWGIEYNCDTDILKDLLVHHGNPNFVQVIPNGKKEPIKKTPLMVASQSCFEKVKTLINEGADINFHDDLRGGVLASAILGGKDAPVITRYLVIEKGIDFRIPMGVTITGDTLKIGDLLRNWAFPINSPEYKIKMEIVNYIERHGENYWKKPIPKHLYKLYSKDYLSKY